MIVNICSIFAIENNLEFRKFMSNFQVLFIMTVKCIRQLFLLLVYVLWTSFVQSQESVNTTGSDATGSGGNVAYSIGQVFFTTNSGDSTNVAQGVQFAYEIFTVANSSIFEVSLTVFPNPTKDILILQISNYDSEKLYYQLYDLQGKMLNVEQILNKQTQINMSGLTSATYFVNIITLGNKIVHSFKIIKI